jgi:heparin binding hemagglutinin HbhA
MARTNSNTQNKVDPTRPFFAAVGSVDAAVAYARSGFAGAQTRFEQAQTRLAKVDLEPRALADGLQKEALALPGRVEALVSELNDTVAETVDELNQQYVDLAARGRTLVNRIRRQQATQDLKTEASSTVTRAKTTRTQTKKAAGTAKRSAKATGTTARKTASAAGKATKAAAAKTGN